MQSLSLMQKETIVFSYDPLTGLGPVLVKDSNGIPDGVSVFLSDNQEGDLNPKQFIIDDPVGLSELAAVPKLLVDQSSELDGSAVLRVEGVEGTGLWLKLKAIETNAILQNSLELLNSSGDSLGAIGGTARSKDLGEKLVYVAAGESARFKQATGGQNDNPTPLINIKESNKAGIRISLDDNETDKDYDDLVISVTSSVFLSAEDLETIKTTPIRRHHHRAFSTSAK